MALRSIVFSLKARPPLPVVVAAPPLGALEAPVGAEEAAPCEDAALPDRECDAGDL